MAKKSTKDKAKRPAVVTATAAADEDRVLGSVLIPVQATISVGAAAQFNELIIEWGCLGLSQEPDIITEVSGNARLLDPRRPPYTDGGGLHVFFDPPLPGATSYGFLFHFAYKDAAEARTAAPKTNEELAKEAQERETASAEA